ncbi:MAG: DEAD/DEAH box helicase [Candidatus Sungbacteria bacterium]|nr:DEAD/DEAH box helicase [Candidatus Sungbacteria bacterium]
MKSHTNESTTDSFYGLGIAPALLEMLKRLRFSAPTPIQKQAIPVAIQGKDLVGIAQTGTGKTLAFGVPMIQRLAQVKGQGLVVLPTRELALQVDEMLKQIGNSLGLRTVVLIGGVALGPQIRLLLKHPHIIIATPGRLIDHLNQKNIRLDGVKIVVLDEADRMLDMGFAPQIQKIFHALPKDRQTMLFSATMPSEIMRMAASHMKLPIRVEIAPTGTTVERVTQELFIVSKDQKVGLLAKLLETYQGSTLVFARTKYGAKRIVRQIRAFGISAAELHSNRSLNQRREALDGFKSGKYRVLVATDIASRGIDVVGIELVLNYDLPSTSEDYVHRIGRTARAGAGGHAITFAMPDQLREVRAIERLTRRNLPVSKLPELPLVRAPELGGPLRRPEYRRPEYLRSGIAHRRPGRLQHRDPGRRRPFGGRH